MSVDLIRIHRVADGGFVNRDEAGAGLDENSDRAAMNIAAEPLTMTVSDETFEAILQMLEQPVSNIDEVASRFASLDVEPTPTSVPNGADHEQLVSAPDPCLIGIHETMEEAEGLGVWKPCSGCYDTEDGHPTRRYDFSPALKTDVGCGCHECGGLGAVWDYHTDEEVSAMIADMLKEDA